MTLFISQTSWGAASRRISKSYMLASIFLLFTQLVLAFPAPTKESTSSAYVESSLLLTSANWSTEIGKGSWFIEFYTPVSPSCKELAPIWQELTSNKEILRTGYPDAPLSLAQVDCNAEQALCVREGVKHIPKLSLYKDGIQTESEFTGNREYTELAAFVDSEAASYRKLKGVSDIAHPLDTSTIPTANEVKGDTIGPKKPQPEIVGPQQQPIDVPKVAPANDAPPVNAPAPGAGAGDEKQVNKAPTVPPKQDLNKEKVAAPPPPTVFQRPNPQGRVLQFGIDEAVKDKQALHEFLSKNENHGATFVKFFAPWCPHCRAMAGAFRQIGEALKDRVSVVEVDCEAHRSICASYSIQGFPTLRMYNDGESTEYRGGRSFDAMRTWALKAGSASGVRQISSNEVHDISRNDEVFFLYLHEEGVPEKEVDAVTRASRILLTTPVHVYRSSDAELVQRYQTRLSKSSVGSTALSGLLVFKDHDDTTPTASLHPSEEKTKGKDLQTSITSWLDSERFPSIVEVTGNTFSEVINNRQNTPVVLAALSDVYHSGRRQGTGTGATMRDEELRSLRELALAWRKKAEEKGKVRNENVAEEKGEHLLFAWIDADRWATAIRKYYSIKPTQVPRLLLADGSRYEYYDLPSRFVDPYSSNQKVNWLDNDQIFEALDLIWKGKGVRAKSSRTYLDRSVRETASFIENSLLWVSNHLFTSFCLMIVVIGLLVSYLRRQARYASLHSQRLPAYGKVD